MTTTAATVHIVDDDASFLAATRGCCGRAGSR